MSWVLCGVAVLASLLIRADGGSIGGAWTNVRAARVIDLTSHVARVNVSVVVRRGGGGALDGMDAVDAVDDEEAIIDKTDAAPYRAFVPVVGDQRLAHFAAFRVVSADGKRAAGLVALSVRLVAEESGRVVYDLAGVLPAPAWNTRRRA